MKKIITLIFFFFTILFAGCNEVDISQVSDEDLERISDKAVVCNEPYIRLGTTCCLDSNTNGICDNDEKETNSNLSETSDDIDKNKIIINNSNSKEDSLEDYVEKDEKEDEFKELKLEIEEKDNSLYFEWNEYNNNDNFDWYSLSQSTKDPEIEERIISSSGLIEDISKTEHKLNSYTEPGYYYFWVDLKLKDDNLIRSNIIKYEIKKTILREDQTYRYCEFTALDKDETIRATVRPSTDDIDSKEKCIDEFEKSIETESRLLCGGQIYYRELLYRDWIDDEYEVILRDTCPEPDFNDKTIISIGGTETKTVTIGSKDYEVYIEGVLSNGLEKIKIDDVSEDFISIFQKIPVSNLYIQILETVPSSRQGVEGYIVIALGNYDFTLTSDDTSEVCYENGQESTEQTSVFAIVSGNEFELKESYCKSDTILNKYSCTGVDDTIEEIEVNCKYGCEYGECLKITDVGCDKATLSSGIISLGEGENTLMNNATLFEVISVGDGFAEVEIDSSSEFIEMCKEITVDGLTILIHDTIESVRENVKGYLEFSYE